MPCIQEENGNLTTEIGEWLEVWRGYCERLMNVKNDWDGEVDYVPVKGPWEKVSEKEMWEALKKMKKGKSSGPSEVTCEMFSNDVCVRELCGVAYGLLMGESMEEEHGCSLVKVKKCVGVWQLPHNQVAGAWDEGGGTFVQKKIEKDG